MNKRRWNGPPPGVEAGDPEPAAARLPLPGECAERTVPERIARAARKRVDDAAWQRAQVWREVARGCPLDAEWQIERRIARIQRVTGVDREAAEALAHSVDPGAVGLTGRKKRLAKVVQGTTADFLDMFFLDLARRAADSVCRLAFPNGEWVGTGFMVSDRLLLTNNHVVPGPTTAAVLRAEFDYELRVAAQQRPVTRFSLDPRTFFHTNKRTDLDFTLVAVGGPVEAGRPLADFGWCRLLETEDRHRLGEFVNIVEHPCGSPKQIVVRENRLVTRLPTVLHYAADTNPGASGSPVFNDEWEVVALHHWGEPHRETSLPDGSPVPGDVNEGIRISAIVHALRAIRHTLPEKKRELLDDVLDSPVGP